MPTKSEEHLIALLQNSATREAGFSELMQRYQQRLYQHIRRIVITHDDTDEILQTTFIKAWEHLDRFRAESQLYSWLYTIATNESLQFLRRKKRRYFLPLEDIRPALHQALQHHAHDLAGDAIQAKLLHGLIELPEKQRVTFILRYFEEMPYEEISKIMGTGVGGLKANYHHAVEKLKQWMERED